MLPATNWVTGELSPGIVSLGEVGVALDRVLLGVEEHADAPAVLEVDDGRLLQGHQRRPIRSRCDHSRRSIAAITLVGQALDVGRAAIGSRRRVPRSAAGARRPAADVRDVLGGRFATAGRGPARVGGAVRHQHRLASRRPAAPSTTGPDACRRIGLDASDVQAGGAPSHSRAATAWPGSTSRRAASTASVSDRGSHDVADGRSRPAGQRRGRPVHRQPDRQCHGAPTARCAPSAWTAPATSRPPGSPPTCGAAEAPAPRASSRPPTEPVAQPGRPATRPGEPSAQMVMTPRSSAR